MIASFQGFYVSLGMKGRYVEWGADRLVTDGYSETQHRRYGIPLFTVVGSVALTSSGWPVISTDTPARRLGTTKFLFSLIRGNM